MSELDFDFEVPLAPFSDALMDSPLWVLWVRDEKDKRILELLTAGYTQSEIADTVGMSNNGGISKRLTKIRNEFIRKTGIKI